MDSLRPLCAIAALLILIVPAAAQQPNKALDADALKVPSPAHNSGKFSAPQFDIGGGKPGQFDLGGSTLQLNTKRQAPDTRVGIEAMDPSTLGGLRKEEPTLPNYFGMTLTKPID